MSCRAHRGSAAALAAALLATASLVHAQAGWPSKPITLVVTVPAGGSIDAVARIVTIPRVRDRMLARGTEPMTMSPEDFTKRLTDDIRRFEPVLKKMGISVY